MQSNETAAIVKKINFLNEIAYLEWVLKRLQHDRGILLGVM